VFVGDAIVGPSGPVASGPAHQTPAPAEPIAFLRPGDGINLAAAGCYSDAITIATARIRLVRPTVVLGWSLARGTVLGLVELRYSPRCRAGWGRVIPAAPVPVRLPGTVMIGVSRPADQAMALLRLSHLIQVQGAILLMGHTCLSAFGTLAVGDGRNASAATARTNCRRA
jgi:hypothetical protein